MKNNQKLQAKTQAERSIKFYDNVVLIIVYNLNVDIIANHSKVALVVNL